MRLRLFIAGLVTISITGAGAGIGLIFSGFLTVLAKNKDIENKFFLFNYVFLLNLILIIIKEGNAG